jgi:hypothetical protein
MIRNEAYNFFVDHVRNENLDGKLFHNCAKRIDELVSPNFHSECDQNKNYLLHFLNNIRIIIFSNYLVTKIDPMELNKRHRHSN